MKWEGCGRKNWWPKFTYYPTIRLDGLRKGKHKVCQNIYCPGQDYSSACQELKHIKYYLKLPLLAVPTATNITKATATGNNNNNNNNNNSPLRS
jgi:hypothetical protein